MNSPKKVQDPKSRSKMMSLAKPKPFQRLRVRSLLLSTTNQKTNQEEFKLENTKLTLRLLLIKRAPTHK